MWWAEYEEHIGEKRNTHKVSVGKPEEREHLVDLGVNGR
jgi:hypothetical protein